MYRMYEEWKGVMLAVGWVMVFLTPLFLGDDVRLSPYVMGL